MLIPLLAFKIVYSSNFLIKIGYGRLNWYRKTGKSPQGMKYYMGQRFLNFIFNRIANTLFIPLNLPNMSFAQKLVWEAQNPMAHWEECFRIGNNTWDRRFLKIIFNRIVHTFFTPLSRPFVSFYTKIGYRRRMCYPTVRTEVNRRHYMV